jgi:protocatechuate 3,4-dioxygenase beta subunit
MARAFWLGLVAVAALFLWSCKASVDPADNGTTKLVTTTIVGTVIDEDGRPVQGAQVSGHGATATTDDAGVFLLKDIRAPVDRCVVMVRKGGYFTGSRAAYPTENKVTMMRLTLQEALVTSTVKASAGGTVSTDGASVQLPANGFVTSTGTPYTGTVSVAMRYQDPLASDFYESFSGDMAAVRTDGSQTELTSYGVVRVLLTGTGGQRLQLKDGATATITYPAASANMTEIPLWYYDETKAIWTEEGKAVKTGNTYVGTVSHFTDWNLDVPNARRAYIEGRVTCGDNMPLPGIVVRIGQVQAITNEDGMYHRRVPADVVFDVEVDAASNMGMSSAAVTIGPIAQDQKLRHDVLVSPCPPVLEVTMVDCNDQPIGGVLQIRTSFGTFISASSTGMYQAIVPSGVEVTLDGYSFDARSITRIDVAPIEAGTTKDLGVVKACSGELASYVDCKLQGGEKGLRVALNADGSKAAVLTPTMLLMYDVGSGTEEWRVSTSPNSLADSKVLTFVAEGRRVALAHKAGTTIVDATSGVTIAQTTLFGQQYVTPNGASIYVQPMSSGDGLPLLIEIDGLSGNQRRTITLASPQPSMNFIGLQGNDVAVFESRVPGSVHLYDLTNGDKIRSIPLPGAVLRGAGSLSPTGRTVIAHEATGDERVSMSFVDLVTGSQISRTSSLSGLVMAVSPDDSQYILLDYSAPLPMVKDVRTHTVRTLLPHQGASSANDPIQFGYSSDSRRIGTLIVGASTKNLLHRDVLRIYTLR